MTAVTDIAPPPATPTTVQGARALVLQWAAQQHFELGIYYRKRGQTTPELRRIRPYRVTATEVYAYDLDREAPRNFRHDRIHGLVL